MEEARPERPLGVAIISVLDILFGILMLFGGILFIAMGPFIMAQMPPEAFPFAQLVGGAIAIVGVAIVVLGLISILLGYLLWNGSNIARLLHIVFAILGIIFDILSFNPLSIIGIIISLIIIWYLTRPHVVNFFSYEE